MRKHLSWKLAAIVTVGIAVVHTGFGFVRIQREVSAFESDTRRDHAAIAHELSVAATFVASREGTVAAIRLIQNANRKTDRAKIQWIKDSTIASEVSQPTAEGFVAESRVDERDEGRFLVSTVPLRLGDESGVLEIREPMSDEETYVAGSIQRTLILTLVLVALCFAIIAGANWFFVRQPMKALLAKVDRVGKGDLSGPLQLKQQDEIGVLAHAINMMCQRLDDLQRKNEKESRAKFAALEQLRHADRLSTVGKLASGIAHELGTPLNVVSARATMIVRREHEKPETASDAQIVIEQAGRMAQTIRQLLDFGRRRKPQRTDEDLGALCEQTLRMLEPLAAKDQVHLELANGTMQALAKVDAGQMQQVLTNVVMNAIQAQPKGGSVRVYVKRSSDLPPTDGSGEPVEHLSICVEDDGDGISDEVREHLFEPFFTTKGVGEGTGLGLSVAYGIIREHGGWIDVQSEPGKGSRFMIHLPQGVA